MKKKLIFISLFLFFIHSYIFSGNCLNDAKKLHDLQNEIITKAFFNLPPGSWAQHGNIKAIYLGKMVSPKTGLKLRVIEFQGRPAGQLWFKLTKKKESYNGQTYEFWTIESMEAYFLLGGRLFYISKPLIELFMQGKSWSTIIFEGQILTPPNCENKVTIKEEIEIFPGGKKIKATIIESDKNHGKVYCSPDVPFGMIKSVDSHGKPDALALIDFGFSGGKSKISTDKLKESTLLPVFGGRFGK